MCPADRPETCATAASQDGCVELNTLVCAEVSITAPLHQRGEQRAHGKQSMQESQWCGGAVAPLGEPHVVSIAPLARADYNNEILTLCYLGL